MCYQFVNRFIRYELFFPVHRNLVHVCKIMFVLWEKLKENFKSLEIKLE